MLSAPMRTAPAASSRSIRGASRLAGGASRLIFDPASVGSPATSKRFLTANGTPASGGRRSPRPPASSSDRVRRSARCSVSAVKELMSGSRARMRANVASTMLEALLRPAATAATMSAAVLQVKSSAGVSSTEHRRWVGVVGQQKLVNDLGMQKEQLQIEPYGGAPGRIDRQ